MTLCDRLRAARLDADLEQKDLARLLGITQQQYSLYETGRRRLPAEMLAPLCRALGVSADYLLGIGDYKDQKLVIDTRGLSENQVSSLAKIVNAVIGEMKRGPDDIFL